MRLLFAVQCIENVKPVFKHTRRLSFVIVAVSHIHIQRQLQKDRRYICCVKA